MGEVGAGAEQEQQQQQRLTPLTKVVPADRAPSQAAYRRLPRRWSRRRRLAHRRG